MAQAFHMFAAMVLRQRGFLFPWSPVFLAAGIGLYFALRFEPSAGALAGCAVVAALGAALSIRRGPIAGPMFMALALIAAGVGLASARAHSVAAPVLDFRYYGPIQGRIIGIDRSSSDALRLTLDEVVLSKMDPGKTPERVRVSLHGQQGFIEPAPGAVVILTGHLSPPGGAVEPGGFDFRRHAWFLKLGAVGYTRTPVLLLAPQGAGQELFQARMWVSKRVRSQLTGETGAFAAALMTGDRSQLGQDVLTNLRATNLAHLLAISGLHMGLLAGFVFAAVRLGLLLIPQARHNWPVKKLAAGAALAVALGYLSLSGGSVATQRAFIMVAVALSAVMLDRRALSLRSVAMAALIILLVRPEALVSAGFQMSFAATTALVFAFEQIKTLQNGRRMPGWFGPIFGVVVSSAVAGAATAPVGMVHFNTLSQFGLLANVVSVPVMGAVVMPMAVLSAVLMPFGLDWIALEIMAFGLDWILFVADHIAAWEGVTRPIKAPGPEVLPLLALGGVIVCLWQGRGRVAGLLPAVAALALWVGSERPVVLISDTGTLVGVMTEQGRALSRPKSARFAARNWLENDGQGGTQEKAANLWPGDIQARIATANVSGWDVVHLQGKRAAARMPECHKFQVVIASAAAAPKGPCEVFDPDRLRATGAVALWPSAQGMRIQTDRQATGQRLWHRAAKAHSVLAAQ